MTRTRSFSASLLFLLLPARALCVSDDMPPEHFRAADLERHADYKGSLPLFELLRSSYAAQGDDERAGMEAQWIGLIERILGRYDKALEDELDSIARMKRTGDKLIEVDAHREAAMALHMLKRDSEAEAQMRDMLRLDDETEQAETLKNDLRAVAEFQKVKGEMIEALATIDRRVLLHSAKGDEFNEGDALISRGEVLRALGRAGEAARDDERGRGLQDVARRRAEKMHVDARVDQLREAALEKDSIYDRAGAHAAWQHMLDVSRTIGFKNGMTAALLNLCISDNNAGEYPRARAECTEGARLAHEDDEGLNETTLTMHLGIVAMNSGDLNEGLGLMRRARGMAVLRRDAMGELEVLKGMRMAYGFRGDYRKIISCNEQMLAVGRRSGKKKAQFEAERMVGEFYEMIGDGGSALEHYTRELELARQLGDRVMVSDGLNEVAGGYAGLGEFEPTEKLYKDSLAIHDWPGGRVNLGDTYLHLSEPEKAYALLHPIDESHIDLGKYYLLKKDFARARDVYAKNVAQTEKDKDVYFAIASETGLGLAYEGLADYPHAAEHYTRSESLIDRLRESLSPAHRLYFMSTWDWQMPHLEPFEGMVRISEFLSGGPREALHHAEFTRGRLFAEATARNYGPERTSLPADVAARESKLTESVTLLANGAEEAFRSNQMDAFHAAEAPLAKAKEERDAFVAGLRKDFPEYAAARYPLPLYADEFQLEPEEVVIEFEVTEPYTKGFVIKNGAVAYQWTVRRTREELSALVKRYRGFFEGVADAASLAAYDPGLGRKLYGLLLEPATKAKDAAGLPLIAEGARLTIVPDEILGILPFESLVVSAPPRAQMPSGRHGPAPVGVSYAGDHYDIAYEHSGTAMTVTRRLQAKRAPTADLFVLADPVFNPADPRLRAGAAAAYAAVPLPPENVKTMGAVATTMGLGGTRRGAAERKEIGREDFLFPRLDKTGTLARDLKDKVFAGSDVETLVGTAASKDELGRRDLSRYRYLVFATHGLLDNMIPGLREPALVLNQLGPGAGSGFLTMSEIMDLKLNADVVALTACQTGLGRQLTGEGVMGLGRAFQYAGARSVLVSLWSVAEDSTTLFAERFFTHLKEGKTKRQALRMARADVRRAGYEHPFYWAPFILIGG